MFRHPRRFPAGFSLAYNPVTSSAGCGCRLRLSAWERKNYARYLLLPVRPRAGRPMTSRRPDVIVLRFNRGRRLPALRIGRNWSFPLAGFGGGYDRSLYPGGGIVGGDDRTAGDVPFEGYDETLFDATLMR